MTAYNASKMASGTQPRVLPRGYIISVVSTFAMTTAAKFATSDTLNLMQLAAYASDPSGYGPTILGVAVDIPQIDSGSGVVFEVGDAGNAARFITASTTGQTGGIQAATVAGTIGYQPEATAFTTYTTVSLQLYTILMTFTTGVTTAVAGTIACKVEYTYDP